MNTPTTPDQIHIKGLQLTTRLGVPEEERATTQVVLADVSFEPVASFHGIKDTLESTIDYAAVALSLQSTAGTGERLLLEKLAEDLAAMLLTNFPIARTRLHLRKFILPDTEYVAVEITRP